MRSLGGARPILNPRRPRHQSLGRMQGGGGETLPLVQTATFGAKTPAGTGIWKPVTSLGNPVDVATYDGLVSGSLGAFVPSVTSAGLRFTGGGAGAPNGVVLNVTTTTGEQVTVTIATEANAYSAAALTEANTAYGTAVLGDTIRIRAGSHNPTAARVIITRAASPAGTWTGTAALSDGNWVTVTRDAGATVTIGALELGTVATTHARYLRLHDVDIASPLQADSSGIGTGVSAGVSAQVFMAGGTHIAITDCRFRHTTQIIGTSVGAFRAITCGNGSAGSADEARWLQGNTINGARHGVIGSCRASVFKANTIKKILSDCMTLSHCAGVKIEDNVFTDKIYGYTVLTPTAITRGATTVFTVADTSAATVGEVSAFTDYGGGFGAVVNGQSSTISAKTGTTLTIAMDTSAAPDWDGLSGVVQVSAGLHGDFLQFNENLGATATQNNVQIRGNRFYRGAADDSLFVDGQPIFGGNTGTTAARDNWLIEGNIVITTAGRGISINELTNSIIRSNTVARVLGIDASTGGSQPGILTDATCNTVEVSDNIACSYSLLGTAITQAGNATITLTTSDAFPATAGSIAAYQEAFAAPVTVANTQFDPVAAFATRTDGGSVFPGPIYPGATPYFDFGTLVYSDPRP